MIGKRELIEKMTDGHNPYVPKEVAENLLVMYDEVKLILKRPEIAASILSDAQELLHRGRRFEANGKINLAKSILFGNMEIIQDGMCYEFKPKGERFCMDCLHCHDKGAECLTEEKWECD